MASKILLVSLAVHTQHLDFLCGLIISFQAVQNAVILGCEVLRQNKCLFRDKEEKKINRQFNKINLKAKQKEATEDQSESALPLAL